MTITDVKNACLSLGFADYIESEPRFVSALNMAIKKLAVSYPKTYRCSLPVFEPKNTIAKNFDVTRVRGGLTLYGEAARAYAFSALGSGKAKISFYNGGASVMDYEVLEEITISSEAFSSFSGLLKKSGSFLGEVPFKIEFIEDGYLVVKDVALYSETNGNVIPKGGMDMKYDINDYIKCEDKAEIECFSRLAELPKCVKNGRLIPIDYALSESVITLFGVSEEEVQLSFYGEPKLLSMDFLDTDSVSVSEAAAHLVPLIVSSYYYLDEDEEKSKYYYALYLEEESRLNNCKRGNGAISVLNLSGWSE